MNAMTAADLRDLRERAIAATRAALGRARETAPSPEELRRSMDEVLRSVGLERRRPAAARLISWPLVVAMLMGASLVFFLDPDAGGRRRTMARDRASGALRDLAGILGRRSRLWGSRLYGASQQMTHRRPAAPPDESTLVERVSSEAFRGLDPDLKGRVNVDAVGGVVYLRGELDRPEDIDAIEAHVRAIAGVEDVENLLHLTGTPARRP